MLRRRAMWFGLAAVLALAACAPHRAAAPTSHQARSAGPAYSATARPSASATPAARASSRGCRDSLWKHVYHPYRLHVIAQCKTVTGVVEDVRHEPDGDLHIRLRVSASLVNAANREYEDGDLVLEVICEGPVTQADAVAACRGYSSPVTVPSVGQEIRVNGSYVLDADHGWLEIHPVSRIVVTGYASPPAPTSAPPPPTSPPPAPSSCYPKTSGGNCYEPGEFCSTAEHGEVGLAGDGQKIKCENTDPGQTWHWVAV